MMDSGQQNALHDKKPESSKDQGVANNDSAQYVEIKLSDDKLQCWLKISKTPEGNMPSVEEAQKILSQNKISQQMIKNEVLEDVFAKSKCDQEILIAEGKPAIDGEKGKVSYLFKCENIANSREKEKARVDFKQTGYVIQVKKGLVLAEIFPPKQGQDGISVTGEVIAAIQYDPIELPSVRTLKNLIKIRIKLLRRLMEWLR